MPDIDENSTNWCTVLLSDSSCSRRTASSFGRNMALTSSSVISVNVTGPPPKAAR